MTAPQKRKLPAATGSRNRANFSYGKSSTSQKLPSNWRARLPDPSSYYQRHIAGLGKPNANGWAQGLCKFHDDSNASFSVNLADSRGHWQCHAGCGKGDLVAFHQRITGLDFVDAVRDLIRGRT